MFLKLQPNIQTSVAHRANHKLSFKYFSPFTVLKRVGLVAYKLELPAGSFVQPVFHVSQLKRAVSSQHQVSATLPDSSIATQIPAKVLDTRTISRGVPPCPKCWSAGQSSMILWQPGKTTTPSANSFQDQLLGGKQHRKQEGMSAMHCCWAST